MHSPIVIQGYTLTPSGGLPATLNYSIEPPVNHPAVRTVGKGAVPVQTGTISFTVNANGVYAPGATFSGKGTGTITASTPRVLCEGAQLLTEGDKVTVTCSGTITTGGAGSPGMATVVVSITNGAQKNVEAGKA